MRTRIAHLVRNLLHRRRVDVDLDDEVQAAFELLVDENVRSGMPPEAARRAATLELGRVEHVKDRIRDVRAGAGVEMLLKETRRAIRGLRNSPGVASAVVVILGLAIGTTSGIFSAVHAILLTRLPISDPDRLVVCWETDLARASAVVELPYTEFEEWRARSRTFATMAGMASSNWTMVMDGHGDPVQLPYAGVTASFFDTLGTQALLGRTFVPDDDVPNAPGVVVLNHGAWVRRFGADPSVVGHSIRLDEKAYTIVGVMPKGFDFPRQVEFWTPVVPTLAANDALTNIGVLFVLGRLKEGVTPAAAGEELRQVVRALRETGPPVLGSSVTVTPFRTYLLGPVRPTLWLLFAAVVVLLLMACANVSALLLARIVLHRHEQAVQIALGASGASVARVWLLEMFMLSAVGGFIGLLVSGLIGLAVGRLAPDDIPRLTDGAVNPAVLTFSGVAVLITTVICGMALYRDSRPTNLWRALNDEAHSTAGRHARRVRSWLVSAQIAFAVVLLVSAGLAVRSFVNLQALDLGFSTHGVVTMEIRPRSAGLSVNDWFAQLLAQVEVFPAVRAAGAVFLPPLAAGPIGAGTWILFDGQPDTPEATRTNPMLNYQIATPGYFSAMGVSLKRGRLFNTNDDSRAPRVVVVGESTARRLWPGQNPIGQRIGLPAFGTGPRAVVWRAVVGVVADVRYRGLHDTSLDIYDPALQAADVAGYLVVRTDVNPLAIVGPIEAAARALDRRVVIDHITTVDAVIARALAPWRLAAWMLTAFATIAALLATVGVFGLVSLDVSSRQHEFAVRLALGAQRANIVRLAVSSAAQQAVFGVGAGLVMAFCATRELQSLLFGVGPLDHLTYSSAVAFVLVIVGIASYVPTRRAFSLDLAMLIRHE